MIEFLKKHKSIILYAVFGVLTTVVDWGVSFVLYYLWGEAIEATPWLVHGADVIAWVAAVSFAYVTNRIWVFKSKRCGLGPILMEFGAFALGRMLTLILQEILMAILFTGAGFNKYIVKIVSAVLVTAINYFMSKLIFFKKKKD